MKQSSPSCSCVRPGYPVKSSCGAHSPHGANLSNVFHNTVCAHLLALRTCSLTHIWKTSGSLWWNTLYYKGNQNGPLSYGKIPKLWRSALTLESWEYIHILMWLPFLWGKKEDSSSFRKVGKMTLKDKTKTFILNFTQLQGRYLDLCIRQSTLLEFFHSESTLGVPGGFF